MHLLQNTIHPDKLNGCNKLVSPMQPFSEMGSDLIQKEISTLSETQTEESTKPQSLEQMTCSL